MKVNSKTRTKISISILTYNRGELLRELLGELQSLTYSPLETIVVDNHSEDGTQKIIRSEYPNVKYIRTDENIGVVARNLGMKRAEGDIVVTLDDDIKGFKDKDIENLIRIFSERSAIGAVNFKVKDSNGNVSNWIHHCKQEEFFDKEFLTYEITEGAVAFRKDALHYSGYYPKDFFISHEGPDLAYRLFENGFNVLYSGNIEVTHCSSDQAREHWRNYYYDTRNQFWLAVRNFPFYYASVYLARGLLSMMIYSIRDGYFLYWLKAIRDGLLGLSSAFKERNVLSSRTIRIIKTIDDNRPGLAYTIRQRLFKKGLRF